MNDALMSKYAVIGVMGPYAGESQEHILRRKTEEIERRLYFLAPSVLSEPPRAVQLREKNHVSA